MEMAGGITFLMEYNAQFHLCVRVRVCLYMCIWCVGVLKKNLHFKGHLVGEDRK